MPSPVPGRPQTPHAAYREHNRLNIVVSNGTSAVLTSDVRNCPHCLDTCRLAALLLAEYTVINEPANGPS